jgi:hypothetical protein
MEVWPRCTSCNHEAVSATDPGPLRFPIFIGSRSRFLLLLFGVRRSNAYVDIDGDLDAHFGFYRMRTPLTNVARWRLEGPWLWITAIGVRRGITNGEITFAGTGRGGVRLDFKEPVKWGPLRPMALYLTVEDMEGFAAALTARGIPGEDARRR